MIDDNNVKALFAANVKQEREERGWSHFTLAKKSGLPKLTVKNCEEKGSFSSVSIASLCNAFNIDPWVLFTEVEE